MEILKLGVNSFYFCLNMQINFNYIINSILHINNLFHFKYLVLVIKK